MRLLVVRVFADAVFFVPALRRLERRYSELAELAADEAAVRAAGSTGLASALLKLGSSDHSEVTVALAPERDHLCGAPTRWRLEPPVLALSLLAVTGSSAAALLVSATAGGTRVDVLAVVAQSCMALMFALAAAGRPKLRLTGSLCSKPEARGSFPRGRARPSAVACGRAGARRSATGSR